MKKNKLILLLIFIVANYSYSQSNCSCQDSKVKSPRYSPLLNDVIKHDTLTKYTDWKIQKELFKKIKAKRYWSNGKSHRLEIFSDRPIKITNSTRSLNINLTPCNNKNNYFEVPINLGMHNDGDYIINFNTIKLSVEVNNEIINSDKKNNSILFNINRLKLSKFTDLGIVTSDVCFKKSNITGTKIEIDFNKASIISKKKNKDPNYIESSFIKKVDYPLLNKEPDYFNTFSGLFIENSKIEIPIKNQIINFDGQNIILNNFLISGILNIDYQTDSGNKILIKSSKGFIKTNVKKLSKYLKKAGLKDFLLDKNNNQIKVFFKKFV